MKNYFELKKLTVGIVLFSILILPFSISAACVKEFGKGNQKLTLAAGSPGELGLLEALVKAFNKRHEVSVCWEKAGSGKSLDLLKAKKVDLVMVHAPDAEKSAVKEGWAILRKLMGSNEFFIVGPKKDPAGIKKATNAADALSKIAKAKAPFISRGDNSGTHQKELAFWKAASISPKGSWYTETKKLMIASLKKANESGAYFMTDSSTWMATQKDLPNLTILYKGDPKMINPYHMLCQPKGITKNQETAERFISFIASVKGQSIIRDFGKKEFGVALYNDAEFAKKYVN